MPLFYISTQRPGMSLHVTTITRGSPTLVLQAANAEVRNWTEGLDMGLQKKEQPVTTTTLAIRSHLIRNLITSTPLSQFTQLQHIVAAAQ